VYTITREQAAAPKAKANILRALISGQIHAKTLYETDFQQIMRQCVNCGSCSLECPSGVNIPKMVLEARSEYAARFGSPLRHHLLTGVETFARSTHQFSSLLTPMMNLSFTRKITERLTGISAQRNLVAFAPVSLRDSLAATQTEVRTPCRQSGVQTSVFKSGVRTSVFKSGVRTSVFKSGVRTSVCKSGVQASACHNKIKILYFAGCYASYIQPAIGRAAVNVLSNMNMAVHIPEQHCCGLPMLSKGMVPQARQKISTNLKKWSYLADLADYIVVTCSSCGYALMKEWQYLQDSPDIDMIRRKTIHITRLINIYFDRLKLRPGKFLPKLAYHAPCHLRIQPDSDCSFTLLARTDGADVKDLKGNCCGMAGSWGMTAKNYHLSKTISADMISKLNRSPAAVGVTDCPTCRIQMEQFSDKPIKHPIEIIADLLYLS